MIGYRLLNSVTSPDVVFMPPMEAELESVVRSEKADILDLIFTCHPITGFPCSSYSMYLSDKTSDEVRSFIEKELLRERPETFDSNLRQALIQDFDSEFIAKVSRNNYESTEAYEERVHSYFEEIREQEDYKKRIDAFVKKYGSQD